MKKSKGSVCNDYPPTAAEAWGKQSAAKKLMPTRIKRSAFMIGREQATHAPWESELKCKAKHGSHCLHMYRAFEMCSA